MDAFLNFETVKLFGNSMLEVRQYDTSLTAYQARVYIVLHIKSSGSPCSLPALVSRQDEGSTSSYCCCFAMTQRPCTAYVCGGEVASVPPGMGAAQACHVCSRVMCVAAVQCSQHSQ